MHFSVLKLLPCAIHYATKTIKTMRQPLRRQLGTRAQFGSSGAPTVLSQSPNYRWGSLALAGSSPI